MALAAEAVRDGHAEAGTGADDYCNGHELGLSGYVEAGLDFDDTTVPQKLRVAST
ncbi:hypothetical protein [Lentzea guizhouensis]|uniref:hypothetical protein n=1 Tax=Lentzea guizhouensis TaxID=1586287 RepID=UPI0014728857|nr:hypothetical protein [Lentzea guizhouensis]